MVLLMVSESVLFSGIMRAGNGTGARSVVMFAMITATGVNVALRTVVATSAGWMTPVDPVIAGIATSGS